MAYISFLKQLNENVLGINSSQLPPFSYNSPVMHDFIPNDYLVEIMKVKTLKTFSTGVFYSRFLKISPEGQKIMQNQAGMDKLLPLLYSLDTEYIYAGFETDEIFYIYPGFKITEEFTPISREWYYKAVDSPGQIVLTQPFIDPDTDKYMLSISTTLGNHSSVIGVVSSDISLENMIDNMNFKLLKTGFILIISKNGSILTPPEEWKLPKEVIRIFDTEFTGIYNSTWNDIQDVSIPPDQRMTFQDANNTEYYFVRSFVRPFESSLDISHYILVCVNKEEVQEPIFYLGDSYGQAYQLIFWVTLSISCGTFVIISISISYTTYKIKQLFQSINSSFIRILYRSTFQNITRGVNLDSLLRVREYIE